MSEKNCVCSSSVKKIYEDAKLFTPGPIQISKSVKEKLSSYNLGSREPFFVDTIEIVLKKLLKVVNLDPKKFASILLQGSGTYGLEATIQTFISNEARVLILVNGAFGERLKIICDIYKLNVKVIKFSETKKMDLSKVEEGIKEYKPTHLLMVHSETSVGQINPIEEVGKRFCKGKDLIFFVDGMSSFGGIPIDIDDIGIDYLVTSPNKCLQCVPGLAIIYARKSKLVDHSRTLSLNLYEQHKLFEKVCQFRFTPPIEVVLALDQALDELIEETIEKRAKRYIENSIALRKGMKEIGLKPFLPDELNGPIVHCYLYPENNFNFQQFYDELYDLGIKIYIYPRKRTSSHPVIRFASIGDLNTDDIANLIKGVKIVKEKMKFY